MGLDVYLYRIDDYAKYKRLTDEYETKSGEQWEAIGDYEKLTEEQKEAAREADLALAKSLGLEEWGKYPGEVKIERDSRLYPEHLFKVGYLRSSYNEGGINRLLRDRLNTSLDDIFEAGDKYEFQPDWQASRARAIKTLEAWRALDARMGGKSYRVFEAKMNMFTRPDEVIRSSADALRAFQEQLEAHKDSEWKSFGNKVGDFYLGEPLKVAALIPGASDLLGRGYATTYVVVEDESGGWYAQALEIVIENCEWVLEQPDKELYWLHWSS